MAYAPSRAEPRVVLDASFMRFGFAFVLTGVAACGSRPVPAPPANVDAALTATAVAAPAQATATADLVQNSPAPPALPIDLEAQATAAWAGRAERSELERAIDLWTRVADSRPSDPAPLVALSRAYVVLADFHLRAPSDAGSRSEALERAIDAAERALMMASPALAAALKKGTPIDEAVKSVEAGNVVVLATYGAALARYSVDKGFTALLMYRGRFTGAMQRVITVAPDTLYAIADRELGAFYARVPGFAGGDLAASRTHFDKALQLAPAALETRLRYAETYAIEARDRALFVKLVGDIASADLGDATVAPENTLVKRRAARIAASTDEIFPK